MRNEILAQRIASWPVPSGWPPIVQQLTNIQTWEDLSPSRRRAWLLWRLVCVMLSDQDLDGQADDLAIGAAVQAGAQRIGRSAIHSAQGKRRRGDVTKRALGEAFDLATFAVQRAERRSTDFVSG